jgi:hypothetical protein
LRWARSDDFYLGINLSKPLLNASHHLRNFVCTKVIEPNSGMKITQGALKCNLVPKQ